MRVFYFKSSDQTDLLRDEQGNKILDKETGKPIEGDYYKIEVKIPKEDCSIDFRTYAKWTPLNLMEIHEGMPSDNGKDSNMTISELLGSTKEAIDRMISVCMGLGDQIDQAYAVTIKSGTKYLTGEEISVTSDTLTDIKVEGGE